MPKSKNKSLKKVTAAGGVVFRFGNDQASEVLLIYRRGVWDLPKGKLEAKEAIEQCAVREVAEEVGLSALPDIERSLTATYHEYKERGQLYGKTTHWYAMKLSTAEETFTPEKKEGITRVKWCSIAEAKTKVGYDNLVEVLEDLERDL